MICDAVFPKNIFCALCTTLLFSVSFSDTTADQFVLEGKVPIEELKPVVKKVVPHDPGAFTQGLLLYEGKFYESTGLYGESSLRRVDPMTGIVEKQHDLSREFFAEGLALVDDHLIQLTWKKGVAFIYSREDFTPLGVFTYQGQGWGLCYDGERLIMSNGSSTLAFRDPNTFDVIDTVTVTEDGRALNSLNELEYVEGYVYSNIWLTNYIVKIDPRNGNVVARIDASGLLTPQEQGPADVLNGIAWDGDKEQFWITGKKWPKMFLVEFVNVNAEKKKTEESVEKNEGE